MSKSHRLVLRDSMYPLLLLWAALAAGPAVAQSAWDSVPSMDVVRNRLSLTPEQEAKLAPIFERRIAELQGLRDKMEQAASRADKRILLRDAKNGQKAFNAQVEELLDVSQKSEWRELRDQTREKVKERIQERQESQ